MSSDSSDDENLDLLKEATDFQFINDSMFNEKTDTTDTVESKIQPEQLPSLRKCKDEDEQFNLFRVTPEFRKHVAKHLMRILDKQVELVQICTDNENNIRKKRRKGIKLLRSSKKYLKDSDSILMKSEGVELNKVKCDRYSKLKTQTNHEFGEEVFKQIAVDPSDILSKKEVKNWSTRTKGAVFNYKKIGKDLLLINDTP